MAVVHLIAPILATRGETDRWIEARAFALTLMMVARVVAPWPPFVMLSPGWYSPAVALGLRSVSAAFAALLAVRALGLARRGSVASSRV